MKITKTLLVKKGACAEAVERFAVLFPRGVVVTEALCVQHAADFDWAWAAENLLLFALWAEYERQRVPLRAEYERQHAQLWAEYERQRAMLFGRLVVEPMPITK